MSFDMAYLFYHAEFGAVNSFYGDPHLEYAVRNYSVYARVALNGFLIRKNDTPAFPVALCQNQTVLL